MRTLSHTLTACLFLVLPAATLAPGLAGTPAAAEPDIEVLARGPVHEAFAQPVDFKQEPPPVIPNQPPPPLQEEVPAQKPEGENVQWLGGYWAWDADRNEFLWISGVWRDAPPGRRYVAGYWEHTPDGWRWVPGFWVPEGQSELPYVPPPPPPPSYGPSIPAPDDNSFYVPGVWLSRDNHHLWRPGHWMACQPGHVWIHAHYAWTPGGCVFVSGYWDRPLHRRGLLFAPVAIRRALLHQAGYAYRPHYAVRHAALLDALFVSPGSRHYYFGDYYGRGYANRGIRPWAAYGAANNDPLYSYYRWTNRNEPNWQAGLNRIYEDRVAGRAPLPPRTLAQQRVALNQSAGPKGARGGNPQQVVASLTQLRESNVRLSAVPASQLAEERARADRVREIATTRQRTEKAVASRPQDARGGSAPAVKALRLPAVGGAPKGKEQNLSGKGEPAPRIKPQPGVNKAPQPAVKGPSPGGPAVAPKAPAPAPKIDPPKTVTKKPGPPVAQPKPPAPAPKGPAVQPKAPRPQPKAPAAQPKPPAPAPKGPAAQPKAPIAQPKIKVDQPKAPAPAPKGPAAQPKAPRPQPKAPAAQPKAPAAQPKIQAAQPRPPAPTPKAPIAQPKAPTPQPKIQAAQPKPPAPKAIQVRPPAAQPKAPAATIQRPRPPVAQPKAPIAQPRAPAVQPRPSNPAPRIAPRPRPQAQSFRPPPSRPPARPSGGGRPGGGGGGKRR